MGLLQDWQAIAFNEKADRGQLQNFWSRYFAIEKSVYEKLLSNPDEAVEGTVKELAERFEIEQPGRSDRRFSCESCFR